MFGIRTVHAKPYRCSDVDFAGPALVILHQTRTPKKLRRAYHSLGKLAKLRFVQEACAVY